MKTPRDRKRGVASSDGARLMGISISPWSRNLCNRKRTKLTLGWVRRPGDRWGPLLIMLLICLAINLEPSEAILNCLSPGMFRMAGAKGAPANGIPGLMQASYDGQVPYQANQMAGLPLGPFMHQPTSPMKRLLFQSKWKGGLFGHKFMSPGANFYRPGFGYPRQPAQFPGYNSPGYPINGDLNVAPFSIPPMAYGQGPFGPDQNDGWSLPAGINYPAKYQQSQVNVYDSSGSYAPAKMSTLTPGAITNLDPYSGGQTKGSSSQTTPSINNNNNAVVNKLATSTTTRNLLIANGGYNLNDAHLIGTNLVKLTNNFTNFGYAYPEWYSGVEAVQSPARIAQQLLKLQQLGASKGLRNQQAPEVGAPPEWIAAALTNLDEPRFVGFGKVDKISSQEIRLTCSFPEPIDQANRPIWVKFSGSPIQSSLYGMNRSSWSPIPPFNCMESQCRVQEIEPNKDDRYTIENGPRSSSLIIQAPRISDFAIYRCSALTLKPINPSNPLASVETSYQIVRFAGPAI